MGVILLILELFTVAGVEVTTGTDANYWNDSFVVYAEFLSAKKTTGTHYVVRVKPIATLAGTYDPSAHSDIIAETEIGSTIGDGSEIPTVPKKNSKILIVIDRRSISATKRNFVPSGPVLFMAGRRGMIEVSGFDDEKVSDTIEN